MTSSHLQQSSANARQKKIWKIKASSSSGKTGISSSEVDQIFGQSVPYAAWQGEVTLVSRTCCRLHLFQAGAWKVKPRLRKASGPMAGTHLFSIGGSLQEEWMAFLAELKNNCSGYHDKPDGQDCLPILAHRGCIKRGE